MRYMFAKVNGGDDRGEILRSDSLDIISFEFIEAEKFDLRIFDKFIKTKSSSYPVMNNSDYSTMFNLGRALVYIERENFISSTKWPFDLYKPTMPPISVMIIDINHPKNRLIKAMLVRDKKINEICSTK